MTGNLDMGLFSIDKVQTGIDFYIGGVKKIGLWANGNELQITDGVQSMVTHLDMRLRQIIAQYWIAKNVDSYIIATPNIASYIAFLGFNGADYSYVAFIMSGANPCFQIDYSGSIIPVSDNLKDLGSSTKHFAGAYVRLVKECNQLELTPHSALLAPPEGAVYYDAVLQKLRVFNGTSWETVSST